MRTKVKFSSDISKDLQIVDQWLTTSNLVVQYIYQGTDYTLDLEQCEAMDILKKYGIVEDVHSMMVKVNDEDGYDVWVEWWDWATSYEFTESDAKEIICGELSDKSIEDWAADVKSIPDMIKTIPAPMSSDSLFEQMANICKAHAKVVYGIDLMGGKKS